MQLLIHNEENRCKKKKRRLSHQFHPVGERRIGFTAHETLRLFLAPAFACTSAVVAMKENSLLYSSPKRNCDNEASPATMRPLIFDAYEHTHTHTQPNTRALTQALKKYHAQHIQSNKFSKMSHARPLSIPRRSFPANPSVFKKQVGSK